jgi:hypothetical protein
MCLGPTGRSNRRPEKLCYEAVLYFDFLPNIVMVIKIRRISYVEMGWGLCVLGKNAHKALIGKPKETTCKT